MKALLVADDEKAITNISEVLKTAGYDVIVYKWLLKAMDNIEEIAPHLIVISTKDYPRHWKTLAQYSTTLATDYTPEIILYAEEPLPEEEEKKAEALHVRGIFDSCEVEGLDKLRKILAKKEDIFSGLLTEPEQGEVTLQDLLPELSDLSKDIDSLKEDLKKPFNIDEAIAQAKKAQEEENKAEEAEQANADTEDNAGNENTEENGLGTENTDFEGNESSENGTESEETETLQDDEAEQAETAGNEADIKESDSSKNTESNEFKTEERESDSAEIAANEAESLEGNGSESSETEIESEETGESKESDDFEIDSEAEIENLESQDKSESSKSDISDIIKENSEKEENAMNENDIEAKLAAIMSANKSEAKEKAAEAGIGNISCSFAFTNPITLAMVTGTARNYNGLTLEFTPDIPSFIMNLTAGTEIDCASLKINGEISDVKCEIMSNDSNKIYLQIKK